MVIPTAPNWFERSFSGLLKFKDETKDSIRKETKYFSLTKGIINYKNLLLISGRIPRFLKSI